jgi:putative ABC transport system ATP-binding protein
VTAQPTETGQPPAAIDLRGVSKTFGSGELAHEALRGVDLTVRPGELVMLVGPSGSGKTTLLSVVGAVLSPSGGEVRIFEQRVDGLDALRLAQLRRDQLGFIFQDHNLLRSLGALNNVAMPLRMQGWSRADAAARARRVLERVGLGDRLESKPAQLSGGQRARVAVARAVAGAPPVILADEPTASLDAESGQAVTTLLRELSREQQATVLIVTHDQRIFHLADRIISIADGRIVEERSQDHETHHS